MRKIRLSVHELVDTLLRSGDLDRRVFNNETMAKGSSIHKKYQDQQGEFYQAEYFFNRTYNFLDYEFNLIGRADGLTIETRQVVIEEIKSTIDDLEHFHQTNEAWHLGQAKCYAYMYLEENRQNKAKVILTYISQVDNSIKQYSYFYTKEELKDYFYNLLNEYISYTTIFFNHQKARNITIKHMEFPFVNVRKGQEEIMTLTSKTIMEKTRAFIEAPTGIGKTVSVLYPSIKSFTSENLDKIFFLSAKGSGQKTAIEALYLLKSQGLVLKTIVLSAKERLNHGQHVTGCKGNDCPYSKGYYQKINTAIVDIFQHHDLFDKRLIEEYAEKYEICPFEFQLDLSIFCDVIIGDYNYIFDEFVYLRRFFDEPNGKKYVTLIDEAHNLVERVRSNYSTLLNTINFLVLKKELSKGPNRAIKTIVNKIVNEILATDEIVDDGEVILPSLSDNLLQLLEKFKASASTILDDEATSEHLKETFFDTNRFLKIYYMLDENFALYIRKTKGVLVDYHIFCLNPKPFIVNGTNKSIATIMFSATLSPNDYYLNLLGYKPSLYYLRVQSPFNKENLRIVIGAGVNTTYKKRNDSYGLITDYILSATQGKKGNFIVFFPSFSYLERVKEYLILIDDIELVVQVAVMSSQQRDEFLTKFAHNPQKTVIGLSVVGGIFSEGVDLEQDRLSGVIIIGVGFPSLSFEKDLIVNYYDNREMSGRNFAYIYPGINRVLQAMGRVIRTENDKGFILLLDHRYLHANYNKIITNYNGVISYASSPEDVKRIIDSTYNKEEVIY